MQYFIDSVLGDDQQDGKTKATAWKSFVPANQVIFTPGDMLFIQAGSVLQGMFKPQGSGNKENPCVVCAHGEGKRPLLQGEGCVLAPIYLYNVEGWEVRGLEITNQGVERGVRRCGILAQLEDYGEASHIVIENNDVHDVNGSNVKADGIMQCGISVVAKSPRTRYVGVKIANNTLTRCDRVGIFCTGITDRQTWFPLLNVHIYGNVLRDIGGDGIHNAGTDGCVIERNRLLGGRMRDDMYCAGIWPWSADNTRICYNEVAYYHGVRDGQGYDCDYNCVGTIQEYNYSHDNDGGFMLVCTAMKKDDLPRQVGTIGSVIRRNLSVNDASRTFHLAGPVEGTRIEDNCVYIGKDLDIPLILATGCLEKMGGPENVLVMRNIFAARGTAHYAHATTRHDDGTFSFEDDAQLKDFLFVSNLFLGNHVAKPKDIVPPAHAKVRMESLENILLDAQGKAKEGLEVLDAYLEYMQLEM